jgi:hypothetical protein
LLLIGVLLAVLAATDTGPLFDDPPTEKERVRATVESFQSAAAEGDFETYCELLTPSARELVRANAARLLEEAGQLPCEEILAAAEDSFAGQRTRIREVIVSGRGALVEASVRTPTSSEVEGRTITLERDEEGNWRVTDPG